MKAKVRFNLSRGKNYMKWKVVSDEGVSYIDPNSHSLRMMNAELKNHRATAQKILDGANKTVCAWIYCDSVHVISKINPIALERHFDRVMYNPRVHPHWYDSQSSNIDNKRYDVLLTASKSIYFLEKTNSKNNV